MACCAIRAPIRSAVGTVILYLSALVASSSSSLTSSGLELCVDSAPLTFGTSPFEVPLPSWDCKPIRPEQQAGCSRAAHALLQKCQLPPGVSSSTGHLSSADVAASTAVVTTATNTRVVTSTDGSPTAAPLPSACRTMEYVVLKRLCDREAPLAQGAGLEQEEEQAAHTAARHATNYQWAGAIGSVATISVAGFVILSVVPALSKVIYTSLLQFLVALAIGTLVGDAVLHLLPHALLSGIHGTVHAREAADSGDDSGSGHGHGHLPNDGGEVGGGGPATAVTWRASMTLVGVLIFYNAERLLGVLTQKKADRSREQLPHQPQSCDDECGSRPADCESCSDVGMVVGHSSTEMKSMVKSVHENRHAHGGLPCSAKVDGFIDAAAAAVKRQDLSLGAEPLLGVAALESATAALDAATLPAAAKKQPEGCAHGKTWVPCPHHQHSAGALGEDSEKRPLAAGARDPAAHEVAPMSGHGDVEGHGHSHHFHPSSLSSVAYMVVAGDGMHNFTDGLAIGVAFSGSLAGGLGTALAVLCHELPHELGDFAMLLKAGMTIKQAFLCNVISAALCLTGSLIGVAVGSVSSSGEQWLFGLCAGIFLYIALVDMMPEISRVDKSRPLLQLLIQDLGLLTGFCIMLTIALFEHSIEKAITWYLP